MTIEVRWESFLAAHYYSSWDACRRHFPTFPNFLFLWLMASLRNRIVALHWRVSELKELQNWGQPLVNSFSWTFPLFIIIHPNAVTSKKAENLKKNTNMKSREIVGMRVVVLRTAFAKTKAKLSTAEKREWETHVKICVGFPGQWTIFTGPSKQILSAFWKGWILNYRFQGRLDI